MKKIKTAADIDEALSLLRKDLMASLESGTFLAEAAFQVITVGTGTPAGTEGTEGDIHLRNTANGTEVFQKTTASTWEMKGITSVLNLYYPTQF